MKKMNDNPIEEKPQEHPTEDTMIRSDETPSTPLVSDQRKKVRRVILLLLVVIFCLMAGFVGARLYENKNGGVITQRPTTSHDGNVTVTQEEEDIASVVDKVSPSVVSVVTKSQTSTYYGPAEQEGAGTGIIVGKDGYILTNKHVVSGVSTVSVVLSDGASYDNVRVLGTDPLNDIAFLKIPNVDNLPVAELGDSTSIRVGQKVIAIGNSLGQYQNTVTSGIISGTGRPIAAKDGGSVESLTDLIQTDAAINPGNSGGPLLNLSGQVIGINTAIVEDAQGIGFAIPINATKGMLKGVLAGGSVERSYLGINYIPLTADAAKRFNLSVKKGAYVYNGEGRSAVASGSPAERAGIKDKDIITKVGGVEVGDRGSVASLVAEYAPGDTIELTILRDNRTMTLKVTLATYKS